MLFMRDEDEVRAELDLRLPGRRAGYCLAGAAGLRELWLVAGDTAALIGHARLMLLARATLRCHRQEEKGKNCRLAKGYRLLW